MEAISKFLKDKCVYERLKDRIKSNVKKVDANPHTRVKPANEHFDSFKTTKDCVLAMYLVWDALETLKLNHSMYLFRNESGFDPTKIVNPHILKHMHALVRDRRHCDVIMAHTMQWYTKDYTPQTDKCCQRKLLAGLIKESGFEKFQVNNKKQEEEPKINRRNLVDGCPSHVTVSIHMDGDDEKPKVIEIPRDTMAKNIQIYLSNNNNKSKLNSTSKVTVIETEKSTDSDSSSVNTDFMCDKGSWRKKSPSKSSSKSSSKSPSKSPSSKSKTPTPAPPAPTICDENDERGMRKGFRRSPSPSRSILSLKGGNTTDSFATDCADNYNDTNSYSYIHNPDLHCIFMEELRKVKKRNRENDWSRRDTMNCQKETNVCCPNDVKEGETILTGILGSRGHSPPPDCPAIGVSHLKESLDGAAKQCPLLHIRYSSIPSLTKTIPHLINQCKQANNVLCGNTGVCEPPSKPKACEKQESSNCSHENSCFHEQVRKGTEDLIECAETTRRFHEVANCEPEPCMDEESVCKPGLVEDLSRRLDKIKHSENMTKLGRLCGHFIAQKRECPKPRCGSAGPPDRIRTDGQYSPANSQSGQPTCTDFNSGDCGCNGYQPDVLSEYGEN